MCVQPTISISYGWRVSAPLTFESTVSIEYPFLIDSARLFCFVVFFLFVFTNILFAISLIIRFLFHFFFRFGSLSIPKHHTNTEFASIPIQSKPEPRKYEVSDQSQMNIRDTKAVLAPSSSCPRTCPVLTSPQEPVCGSDGFIVSCFSFKALFIFHSPHLIYWLFPVFQYANSCEMKKKTCIRNGATNVKVIFCFSEIGVWF